MYREKTLKRCINKREPISSVESFTLAFNRKQISWAKSETVYKTNGHGSKASLVSCISQVSATGLFSYVYHSLGTASAGGAATRYTREKTGNE